MYTVKKEIINIINDAPTLSIDEDFMQLILNKKCMTIVTNEYLKSLYNIRAHGVWIPNYTSQFRNPGRQCSLCGKIVEFSENFCPNCGAYMVGDKNDV